METCEVCYSEFKRQEMVSLKCAHFFCEDCAKDHITSNIEKGNAVKIKCMSFGCKIDYEADDIKKFVTEEQFTLYSNIRQDVIVGKNDKLKWCATPDCGAVIKRPGCCCKRKTLCGECGESTCFECGKQWHEGRCIVEDLLDPTIAKYLLVAECIKCKVPITKNGACNHMTCTRCNASFCWICRQDYTNHKQKGPYDIQFRIGCDLMIGDTAARWLLCCFLFLIFSPLVLLIEVAIAVGHYMAKNLMDEVYEGISSDSDKTRRFTAIIFLMGLSFLPFYLIVCAILLPIVIVCRLYQMCEIFFTKVAGQCFRKLFCGCCY